MKKPTFLIYLNILYIFDQNFTLVPTIKLLEFSDKNWETWWASFDVFGRFFDYFFFRPKFQKWNLIKNPWYTKILHCTTLIFPQKIRILRFFLRKFLLTVLYEFSLKIPPKFHKILKKTDFSIYPNILYIYDQNFMLVPTIKLLEFSDKKLRNLWASFDFLVHFLIIFFIVQSFKNEIL